MFISFRQLVGAAFIRGRRLLLKYVAVVHLLDLDLAASYCSEVREPREPLCCSPVGFLFGVLHYFKLKFNLVDAFASSNGDKKQLLLA